MTRWSFFIDVGGTFTDVLARRPDGTEVSCKLLSSGVWKGVVGSGERQAIVDPARAEVANGFWIGFRLRIGGEERLVVGHESARLTVAPGLAAAPAPGTRYELVSDEDAPIIAIRLLCGLRRDQPLPPCDMRLGTTRGTNALLERRGASTALAVTRGFGDLLAIGTQARPKLFALTIHKRAPLYSRVVEIDERVDAAGAVVRAPDPAVVKKQLESLAAGGATSIAICLLHACRNPAHERLVVELARAVGFLHVSASHERAPGEKIVARAETTVVDAYLSPVLADYVARLRAALGPAGTLQIMTSSGGLVAAERLTGADSILSGPAGGVVGAARAAEVAGFGDAIGFDMGGTSTDVSRIGAGGALERTYEADKAGVHLALPMLAIETVAAGGGSICTFDGVKLTVGPQSAGAEPGPACYGRGGPLTVTDCNLLLGRIAPERFPFPLDRAAAERALAAVAARAGLAPAAAAQGFVAVANAAMARAIRAISVARGYDPAEHVLVCFGGAGGQHACALARELRMRRVLVPPHAGVLSAWGVGLADVRRLRAASVLAPLGREALARLEATFRALEEAAHADVRADGVPPGRIDPPVCALELRYAGVDATLVVPRPDDSNWAAAYERQHEQCYGYRHAGRPLEIVAARVEVVGRSAAAARVDTAQRGGLRAGESIEGPAVLAEPHATTVVDAGWRAQVTARGDLLLEDHGAPGAPLSATADPVQLEIFHNHFAAVAEQMGLQLARTAGSTNIKERLDFSCALFTAKGELVVNAPHIPVHLGAMSETVRAVLEDNPALVPGDIIVTNDPARGGTHLPDITVVTPVHDDAGELLFFTASRAHHADVGGIVPGSMPPFSRTLAEEGVVLRNFKLATGGRSHEEELAALLAAGPHPARRIADNLADIAAQAAANQTGVVRLRELVARHGRDVVLAYMKHIQDAAAHKMRLALLRLRPGRHSFLEHLDDGSPIAATLTIAPDRAVIDFTGTGGALGGNLNANRAIVTAAVLYCFRCLIDEDVPLNAGVLAPLELHIPPGSLLDPPREAAVVGGNVETSQRLVDTLLGALGLAAASQGTMNNLTFGNERFGYYETICGGAGATPEADGADAVHTHMTNTRLTDPEVLERRYPVRLVRFAIRRGSGGAGRRRGGDGTVREIDFLAPLDVSILSERRGPYPPYGLLGGAPGAVGRNWVLRKGAAAPEALGAKTAFSVAAGDRLIIETPGGGGYGQG